jgi:hypothetical protein
VLLTSVFAGNSSKIARARMHALSVCKVRSHLAFYGSESEPYRGVKAVPPTLATRSAQRAAGSERRIR